MKNHKGEEMPECFRPYTPFLDTCSNAIESETDFIIVKDVNGNDVKIMHFVPKCRKCFEEHGFTDSIE